MKLGLGSRSSRQSAKNVTLEVLSALAQAVDGLPVPGAKASIGAVVQFIKAADVSTIYGGVHSDSQALAFKQRVKANDDELIQLKDSILELIGVLERTRHSRAGMPEALANNMEDLFQCVVQV
jgi:hypothetical protein